MTNLNLKDLSSEQLQRIIDLKSQIEALESELESVLGGSAPRRGRPPGSAKGPGRPKGKRRMSAAGRAAIAAAARKRWAQYRGDKPAKTVGKKKRTMSAAGRAKIAAAAKARWAKAKAEGKMRL